MSDANSLTLSRPDVSGIIAVFGIIIVLVALLTTLQRHPYTVGTPTTTTQEESLEQPAFAMHRLIDANWADPVHPANTEHNTTAHPFHGTYSGMSIEGQHKNHYEMTLERTNNEVTGKIRTPYGKSGSLHGHINGNTFIYEWIMEEQSGKGLYLEDNGILRGTWGYGYSAQDGGRSVMKLQKP